MKIDYSSIKISDINTNDFPDFTDAFCEYAEWEDGTPLTDEELETVDVNDFIHDNQLYL